MGCPVIAAHIKMTLLCQEVFLARGLVIN